MWLEGLIIAAILAVVGAAGFAIWNNDQKPIIELRKDEWSCVEEENRTRLQPMPIGRMTIMQPITSTVCVEYRRNE